MSTILKRRELVLKFKPATEAEFKALGDDIPDGYVAGWASTVDLDSYNDVIKTGAFDDSIAARGLQGPKGIKLLIGHNWQKPAGAIKVLETRNGNLWIEAQMELGISYVNDFYLAMKASGGMSFSVGFMLQDYAFKKDEKDVTFLEIQRGDLFEVSIVPFPGNEECIMEFIKSQRKELEDNDAILDNLDPPATLAEFEKRLVGLGLVKTRTEARLITLEVKSSVGLFSKKEPEPVSEPTPEPEPVEPPSLLEAESIATLQASMDRLKSLFKPAA